MSEEKKVEIPKNHVFANAVVFTKALDFVLLGTRTKEPFKGQLNFPGGRVKDGESYDEAALRELLEETTLHEEKIHPVGIYQLSQWFDTNGYVTATLATVLFIYENQLNEPVWLSDHSADNSGLTNTKFRAVAWNLLADFLKNDHLADRGDVFSTIFSGQHRLSSLGYPECLDDK